MKQVMEITTKRLELILRVLDMISEGENGKILLRHAVDHAWTVGDWHELGRLREDLRVRLTMMKELSSFE